jgi:hypothetical protein
MTINIFKKIIKMSNDLAEFTEESQEHFSFLVIRNKIVCYGKNKKYRTDPMSHKMNCRFSAIHSEWAAIKAFPYPLKELKKFDLLNVRLNRNRNIMLAKPCKNCQEMLSIFEPASIWFTNRQGEFETFHC